MIHNESIMRKLYNINNDISYKSITNFEQAKKEKKAVVIFEGDYGGIIYLTCPIQLVKCNEETLYYLLKKIDSFYWKDIDGANIFYEIIEDGEHVAGGVNGGQVLEKLWIHPKVLDLGLGTEIEKLIFNNK